MFTRPTAVDFHFLIRSLAIPSGWQTFLEKGAIGGHAMVSTSTDWPIYRKRRDLEGCMQSSGQVASYNEISYLNSLGV